MKRFIISLVVVFSVTVAFAQNATPADPATIEALRAEIAALQAQLEALQAATTSQPQFTVAVMEVLDAGMIPEVGDSFRMILISALREMGILAVESLDRETQGAVDRQREAVMRGYVNPATVPPQSQMWGVRYFLFGVVVKYTEEDREDDLGGAILEHLRVGGRVRLRTGSLVVDFRLIDAQTGIAVDAFRTEAAVREREVDGLEINGFSFGGRSRQRALPELAARECARQAAARVRQFAAPSSAAVESSSMRLTPPR